MIDSITSAYNKNFPDFIYFVTFYNIFNEFLEDVSEDVLPNESTGFKESKILGMPYNFQKAAALAIINKLEKYNGCILADKITHSINEGNKKPITFTAFADTDGYFYDNVSRYVKDKYGLNTATVSGFVEGRMTCPKLRADLNTILT